MIYIFDLQYFPSIYYINTLYKLSNFTFTSNHPFKKSTLRNKTFLAGPNGVQSLSVPIKGGRGVKLEYGQVQPDNRTDWQTNHFRTIKTIYGNSPFFLLYENSLKELYASRPNFLFEWNLSCLEFFIRFGKMSNMIQMNFSNAFLPNIESIELSIKEVVIQDEQAFPPYQQVFMDKTGFKPNMSCLDLLMNMGPDSSRYILDLSNKLH